MRTKEVENLLRLLTHSVVFISLLLLAQAHAKPTVQASTCPTIQSTPSLTIAYGSVALDGAAAPVGTVVEAVSPRDDVVGCFVVETAGQYGSMFVYGEDTSVDPPIPGMRDGETVAFRVSGTPASSSPALVWHNDLDLHEVALSAGPCYDLDGSGTVGVGDFQIMNDLWRATDSTSLDLCDFNENGIIDIGDFATLGIHFGESSCSS